MNLDTIELNPGADARATIIIVHGLGADGTDFLPMADELRLAAVGPVRYVFPRGPVRPVTINGGQPMRAWYDILGTDLLRREDEAGLRESFAMVQQLIDREVARGVPARRIVLGGFSQGCAITLGAGLRYGQRLAGLAALSGYLPLADKLAAERSSINLVIPIYLAHGLADPVFPVARAEASRQALLQLGYRVAWHTYPMPHSVHPQEVRDIVHFLQEVLPAKRG